MDEQNRIVDHSPLLALARDDAGREGARVVQMTVGALWRLIHEAPLAAMAKREARLHDQGPITSAR